MNKIHHINLGAYPFAVNDDAFLMLDEYMSKLDLQFKRSEGYKEIMEDIESRIAELFKEYLGQQQIVTMEHVEKMIQVMGTADKMSDKGAEDAFEYGQNWNYHTGKRLFRDPYDKKIAGVCSGIAHYFGIEDPTWVRVAFVFFGMWGFGILLYLILMFIMPIAYSSSDRLAMKGKPINIQNIAEKVEEEIDEMSDRFDQWRDKWKRKKNRKKWSA